AHYDSCRIRAHIQTLSVQKCGWRQNALDLACVQIQRHSGAQSAKCRGFHATAASAGKLANLREAQEIGDGGLATPVFVRAVWMQPIATAARFHVDERR